MAAQVQLPLRYNEICELIPHRYPFLLVDGVTEFVDAKWIKGFKNVTANEDFFNGHFPGKPMMPGVLMLEALAQLGAIFAKLSTGGSQGGQGGKLIVFAGTEEVRFRRPVIPGDVLTLKMTLLKAKLGHWKMHGEIWVGEDSAVEGVLRAAELR